MQPDRTAELTRLLRERILVLDGAMGTMIQQCRLTEARLPRRAFHDHPHDLEGDNDLLVADAARDGRARSTTRTSRPAPTSIETNTFSATRIAQADYRMEAQVRDDQRRGGAHRARVRRRWTARTPDQPRFVAGALGPDQPHGVDLARRQRSGRAQRRLRRARRRVRAKRPTA